MTPIARAHAHLRHQEARGPARGPDRDGARARRASASKRLDKQLDRRARDACRQRLAHERWPVHEHAGRARRYRRPPNRCTASQPRSDTPGHRLAETKDVGHDPDAIGGEQRVSATAPASRVRPALQPATPAPRPPAAAATPDRPIPHWPATRIRRRTVLDGLINEYQPAA